VLDGQQRLTSMYLSLCSGKPVKTKTEKGVRMHRLLDRPEVEIFGLSEISGFHEKELTSHH